MMTICLLFTRRKNELEKASLTVQLVFVNLVTCLSIIIYPFMNFISKKCTKCQINSLLTTCLIIVTFGLKLTIFCTRHHDMRSNLTRIKLNMTEISHRWVKLLNVMIWLIPIGMFVTVFVYFPKEIPLKFIFQPIECNYTMLTEDTCIVYLVQNALLSGSYILVILVILILTCKIVYMHHQANKFRGIIGFHQIHQELRLRNKLFLETFVFLIWWAPGSTVGICNIVSYALNQEPMKIPIISYMQLFTSPSQGIVDLILFLLGSPQITKYPNMILTRRNNTNQTSSENLHTTYANFEHRNHSLRKRGITD